jgi:PST family polysaccharide transporter
MAAAFQAPRATPAYALLGVSMFIRGFANLGVKEAMRSYQFWREASVLAGSQFFWTLTTIYAAFQLKDFNAVAIGVIGAAVAYVALSHGFSPRRWRLGWDKRIADEAISFGRPLIPTGAANAFIQLGDRFVIGAVLGAVPLAIYNVAMVTALLPRNIVAKFLITLFMPAFVNLGPKRAREAGLFDAWTLVLSTLGFSYGVGLITMGPVLIDWIFGPRFRPTELVMGLIAVNVCAKFLDPLPVPASLAYGQTRFLLFGTLASAAGVALGLMALPNFELFVGALAIGEVFALAWITERSIRLYGLSRNLTWFTVGVPVAALSALVALHEFVAMPFGTWVAVGWTAGALTLASLLAATARSGLDLRALLVDLRLSGTSAVDATAEFVAAEAISP